MTSFAEPVIKDPKLLSLIAEARRMKGVHVYYGEPVGDHTVGWKFDSMIHDLSKITTQQLTYIVLARATSDDATCAIGLSDKDDNSNVAVEIGITPSFAYGSILENGKWNQVNYSDSVVFKTGNFAVLNIKLAGPFNSQSSVEATFEINGIAAPKNRKFAPANWIPNLARILYHHSNQFKNVVVLEHHFVYGGITEGIRQQPNTKMITSNTGGKAQELSLSIGGWVVLSGRYKEIDKKHDGILVGYRLKNNHFHVFPKKTPTFRISVTYVGIRVVTKDKSVHLKGEKPEDKWIDIILQNFDIDTMEFHTGYLKRQ
ncbi:uncharacterized protein [Dermacentor albipictus]|uniref:uncharacterized protein n=1 Tax=Dermacentor albipictus TaxID=60249 RepID=UPI0038FCDC51